MTGGGKKSVAKFIESGEGLSFSHDTDEDAYAEGCLAAKSLDSICYYVDTSYEYQQWREGFEDTSQTMALDECLLEEQKEHRDPYLILEELEELEKDEY